MGAIKRSGMLVVHFGSHNYFGLWRHLMLDRYHFHVKRYTLSGTAERVLKSGAEHERVSGRKLGGRGCPGAYSLENL